ncbi:hypothetical protein BJ085DRAFT_28269 [Dimargaris cristalligena]|uniref:Peptidase A2 domain-containing protein n=1 Tax=Dimargaris cristalligena TaxID=215637 RepID=A0A4P9ZJA7_9FUNG|nr:hypothetical protein BJ085DRAFT_28269 [Dimargaris cristalligena]|eukprot:RKP33108.1 hypothetical protein BJ085DRAFT_28269 [Dimargaris cristalligena]
MEHLGRNNLGLSAWEYLVIVPRARKLVRQHLAKHHQYVEPRETGTEPTVHEVQVDETSDSESDEDWVTNHRAERTSRANTRIVASVLRLPTMIIPAMIGGVRTDVLIDTGSEVNLVPARLARLFPAGTVQLHPEIPKVFGVGESAVESGKAVWDVLVTTGRISVPTSFLVVDDNHQQTILGMPWLSAVDWVVSKTPAGQKQLVVTWKGSTESFPIPEAPVTDHIRSSAITIDRVHTRAAKFKPAHRKVHPVAAPVPAEYQQEYPITGRDVFDDTDLDHTGDLRLTAENMKTLVVGDGELTATETRYFLNRLREVDHVFAFNKTHLGMIKLEFAPPVRVASVPHVPWNYKPFAVPQAMHDQVVAMLKDRLETGFSARKCGDDTQCRCATGGQRNGGRGVRVQPHHQI